MIEVIVKQPDKFLYLFDMIGIFACTFAATLLAKQKGLDVFGCILISIVASIGGGTLRDVLIDRHPLFWMTDLNYLYLIVTVSLMVQLFFDLADKVQHLIVRFDAIGLAAFTLIGLKVGLAQELHPMICVMLGAMTAIFGGMMRDIICNDIPMVLHREVYITASLIGSCAYLVLRTNNLEVWVLDLTCVFLIYVIRMLAVHNDWHLPNISLDFNKTK